MVDKCSLSGKALACCALFLACFATVSYAQTGALRGGLAVLSNANGNITISAPPAVGQSYTLTLPSQSTTFLQTRYLYDSAGFLEWGVPSGTAGSSGSLQISPSSTQLTTDNSQYLFDIAYAPNVTGPLPGAVIVSEVNNPNPTATGIHVTAGNTNPSASGVTLTGTIINVSNAGSGTQVGLNINATNGGVTGGGNANNFAMLFTAGNVGIGTNTPGESLEANGNIRIIGQNGLKITEGSNATMGTATANGQNAVVINTTKVTANSRIFLTAQTPGAGPGALYVSARNAGVSFTIKSTVVGDNSTVAWVILEP